MPFGASLKFAAAQNFLEKPSLRTTFTKYVRARFERTNDFSMVGGRSARFTYRAIFWRSRIAKLIDLRPRQSSIRRSGSQNAGAFLQGSTMSNTARPALRFCAITSSFFFNDTATTE